MPSITTLIPDIQAVLATPQGAAKADEMAMEIGVNVGHRMRRALNREERVRKQNVLFPSELGHPCVRKSWYDFNYDPATMLPTEEISPATRLKFSYGDIIEALIIPLAKAAGHDVTHVDERTNWSVDGMPHWSVSGRIDMVVDGHVVDVKSMAARSFDRWAMAGITADSFGYSAQVASYRYALGHIAEPYKPSIGGYILAVDKEGGKMSLVRTNDNDVQKLASLKAMEAENVVPHSPRIPVVPDGKSGNMKLGMHCSYCKYRDECWKDSNGGRGLRKFVYSYGPVWLAEVAREPKVPETT